MTAEDIIGCKLKIVNPRPGHEEFKDIVGEWVINSSDELDCAFYLKFYTNNGKDLHVQAFYPDEVEIIEKRDVEAAIIKTNLLADTAQQLLDAMGYYDPYKEAQNENSKKPN